MNRMKADCAKFEALFADAVDGTLDGADRSRLEAHLAGCARCREELELARAGSELLDRLPEEELPPFFRTRLLAEVDAVQRVIEPAHRRLPLRSLRLAWGTSAALALVLVGTVLWFQAARIGVRPSKTSALLLSQAEAPEAQPADEARITALKAGIEPVSPLDDSVVNASGVAICAALSPTLPKAKFRLLVDGRDVTTLADVTRDYIIFDPAESLGDGPHMVTVELDTGHERIEKTWIFYAMDGGGRKELPESRTPEHPAAPKGGVS